MIDTINTTDSRPGFMRYLLAGIFAGLIIAVINNFYSFVYSAVTGVSMPDVIHFGSVAGASVVPAVIGGLIYYGLSKVTARATLIFMIGAGLFALASCYGPLQDQLPDGRQVPAGWVGLTLPMHLIAGLVAVVFIPVYVHRGKIRI